MIPTSGAAKIQSAAVGDARPAIRAGPNIAHPNHARRSLGAPRIAWFVSFVFMVFGCGGLPGPPEVPAHPSYAGGLWLGGGGTRDLSTPMPQIPWPLPAASAADRLVLDARAAGTRLGDYFEAIGAMLRRGGLPGRVYAIGADGFAVVTEMESIGDDGRPRADIGRFHFGEEGELPPVFSLKGYLDVLLNRAPGRYRCFVFAVTSRVVAPSGDPLSWRGASQLYSQGPLNLPGALADQAAPPGTDVSLLVYEFRRLTADDSHPSFVSRSALTVAQHMAGAGIAGEGQ